MAGSSSHKAFVNLLQDGLQGSDGMRREISESRLVDDFFSETNVEEITNTSTDKIRIATFDVFNYKPDEVEWTVEEGSISIRGKKFKATTTGSSGQNFYRCIPIPDNINPKTVTARFCVGDGLLIVEGTKLNKPPLKRMKSKSAFFGDSHFSVSVDLGDGSPVNMEYGVLEDKPKEERIQLF